MSADAVQSLQLCLENLILIVPIALLAVAAWNDIMTRTIPDWISIAIAVAGVSSRMFAGPGAAALSVLTAAAVFAGLALIYARGFLGGGDVKLMAATSVLFPPASVWALFFATSIAGGVLAAMHLIIRRLPHPARSRAGSSRLLRLWTIERWRVRRHGSLPYGVAIACGGFWTILSGWRI